MSSTNIILIIVSIMLFVIGVSFQVDTIKDNALKQSMVKFKGVYESLLDLDVTIFVISIIVSGFYIIYFLINAFQSISFLKKLTQETVFISRVIILISFLVVSISLLLGNYFIAFSITQLVLILTILLLHLSDKKKIV